VEQLWLPAIQPAEHATKPAKRSPKAETRIKILASVVALVKARRTRRGARWLMGAVDDSTLRDQDRMTLTRALRELVAGVERATEKH
jgi:hypothetical protein